LAGGEGPILITPFFQTTDGTIRTYVGDALAVLREMPADSVHCCVTSPPYFGLRDYGVDGQIGLEETPAEFVARLVEVFREVRRVLHPSGVCWVNMGDSYARQGGRDSQQPRRWDGRKNDPGAMHSTRHASDFGLKPKDIIGVPWMLAFALRDDGWYLRQEIIWHKPAPMPESVTDRCTKAHEQVFLLAKNERYFYDAEAVKIRQSESTGSRMLRGVSSDHKNVNGAGGQSKHSINQPREYGEGYDLPSMANRRSVWTVASEPFPGSHFATFPSELIRPMIRAGTSEWGVCPKCLAPWKRVTERRKTFQSGSGKSGNAINGKQNLAASDANSTPDIRKGPCVTTTTRGWQPTCECWAGEPIPATILDPFGGSGTTGMVARQECRACVMIELNPEYAAMHRARVMQVKTMADEDAPLLAMAD